MPTPARPTTLAVRADMTVTFGLAKVGLYTLPGSEYAGRVQVVDIGLPKDAERDVPVELLSTSWVRERAAGAAEVRQQGHVRARAGRRRVGELRRRAAARRRGRVSCRRRAGDDCCARAPAQLRSPPALPEATYVTLESTPALDIDQARKIIDEVPDAAAMVIGPGLSQNDGVRDAVLYVLSNARGAHVIDADALNVLAASPGWHKNVGGACILTPHPGEMARLLGSTIEDVQRDRLNVAMNAARDWGHVVVLKGAHTIVAAPDGRAMISPYANPLLATAGTGDVLAGVIAGLAAQGMPPFEAAACGVYIHAFAAEELGEELGDRGMLASDLLPAIPRAIRTIREGKRAARRSIAVRHDEPRVAGRAVRRGDGGALTMSALLLPLPDLG